MGVEQMLKVSHFHQLDLENTMLSKGSMSDPLGRTALQLFDTPFDVTLISNHSCHGCDGRNAVPRRLNGNGASDKNARRRKKPTQDKNRCAFKLRGLPPILWLNLDKDSHRKKHMEDRFEYWKVIEHTRISGFDGREGDVTEYLTGTIPERMSREEIACCLSHLQAVKYFIEQTDYDKIIIMEDDVDFSTARCWNFSWNDFISRPLNEYDTIQFTVINDLEIYMNLHPRSSIDYSAAAYIITRRHAEKL